VSVLLVTLMPEAGARPTTTATTHRDGRKLLIEFVGWESPRTAPRFSSRDVMARELDPKTSWPIYSALANWPTPMLDPDPRPRSVIERLKTPALRSSIGRMAAIK